MEHDWKLGWRLWSARSYTDAIDTRNGDEVRLRLLRSDGTVVYDRFGPNVGQPDPEPPEHPDHRDIETLGAGLSLGCWTMDGCYSFELEREEVHAKVTLSDSRSVACVPSNDPLMRSGVLVADIELLRISAGYELCFELVGPPQLNVVAVGGGVRLRGRCAMVTRGTSSLCFGRIPEEINEDKAFKRIRYMRSYVKHYGPDQLSGSSRMGHAVRWNLCWDREQRDVYLAVSRSWVEMISRALGVAPEPASSLIFSWDALLSAMLIGQSLPSVARAIVRSVLRTQLPDGRLPAMSLGSMRSTRAAPPVLALAAWYLTYDGRSSFAEEVFDALARSHRWIIANREPRGDGLLCWSDGGAQRDDEVGGDLHIDGWVGAAYESGLDDSPMWEELGFDEHTRSLGSGCVDLSSLTALSARVLAELARRTGNDPAPFIADYRRIGRAINSRMWGDDGLYRNLRLDGSRAGELSPTSFYPLTAGVASRDQAAHTVATWLINPEVFSRWPVLPSVPRNSRHYDGDGDYWRGRIWPPMSYLTFAGLVQLGPDSAAPFAQRCRELFDQEWERDGHVHENYSGNTGRGEPSGSAYARSCPFYCWGGLLLLPDYEAKSGSPLSLLPRISLD